MDILTDVELRCGCCVAFSDSPSHDRNLLDVILYIRVRFEEQREVCETPNRDEVNFSILHRCDLIVHLMEDILCDRGSLRDRQNHAANTSLSMEHITVILVTSQWLVCSFVHLNALNTCELQQSNSVLRYILQRRVAMDSRNAWGINERVRTLTSKSSERAYR